MMTSKEFFEKLNSDEAFSKEISAKAKAKSDAGETDYKKVLIPLAAEYGYELTAEELDAMYEKSAELTDEELGKVSGGTSPVCGIIIVSILATSAYNSYKAVNSEKPW